MEEIEGSGFPNPVKKPKMRIQIVIYSFLVLTGQSCATILGRLYYEKGGKDKYIAALVQSAGFPVLIPLLYVTRNENPESEKPQLTKWYDRVILPALYLAFGTSLAFICMLYAIGLMYLPVSTYSLICVSQLGFNAVFSYFLNSQKITPFVLNSIYLLTLSSVLLVSNSDSSDTFKKGKYMLGFACTLCGSIAYALTLSLQQLAYGKVLRKQTINTILKVILYESMVTSFTLTTGIFASGDWKGLKKEANEFKLGKNMYAIILVCTAISWQAYAVGMVALVLKISALFANVVNILNVPVVPVLATMVFRDKVRGVKVVAMMLAIWGSLSYVYQQYLDEKASKEEDEDGPSRD